MENENWYRQLLALMLLSGTRAAVDFITNPVSREDASKQLRTALADIDYDALARGAVRLIDSMADTSKGRLADTIDTLRDRGVEAVDDAKSKAEELSGKRKKSGKGRWLVALALGGVIAYFLMDEQRRDDILDRLTGASGPIQQGAPSMYQEAASAAQTAASKAPDGMKDQAKTAADEIKKEADKASEKSK
jgi:hypothetical protein